MGRGIGRSQRRIGIGIATSYAGGEVATCSGAGQSFNGSDQYAFIADNGALDVAEATTDFCICGWVKSSTTDAGGLFGKGVFGSVDGRYAFHKNGTSGEIRLNLETTESNITLDTGILNNANTWNHVLTRIDITNSLFYLYANGVLVNTGGTAYSGSFPNMDNVYEFNIGAFNSALGNTLSFYSKAQIKDVRIYHKDVTPKLTELMAGEKLGDEVAWWCLPALEGFDNTDLDLTGVNL